MRNELPTKPDEITLPQNHVYLGFEKEVPYIQNNFKGNHSNEWFEPANGHSYGNHYCVEFGTPNWNRWAEVKFDLEQISDTMVFVGKKEDLVKLGIKSFRGRNSVGKTWGGIPSSINKLDVDIMFDGVYLLMDKTDPQYDLVRDYFCNEPQIDSEETLDESDLQLLREYKRACKDLQEAKDNDYEIQLLNYRSRNPESSEYIVIKNDMVYLRNLHNYHHLWSDCKIIKSNPVPSFEIEGDGKGPYKPKYTKDGWKFGCKLIGFDIISNLDNNLPSGVEGVKIGKGYFSTQQIAELNKYQQIFE